MSALVQSKLWKRAYISVGLLSVYALDSIKNEMMREDCDIKEAATLI